MYHYIQGLFRLARLWLKKVLLKLKDNGTYVDIFPQTTADNVIISESDGTTVKDKLDDTSTALDIKMNKENPIKFIGQLVR